MKQQPSQLWELSTVAHKNSCRWFDDKEVASDISHMILSLCGEAGALANIAKLIDRDDLDPNDAHARFEMIMKLSDIFTYVLNISSLLKCDLLRAYEQRVMENERRFAEGKEKERKEPGWKRLEADWG